MNHWPLCGGESEEEVESKNEVTEMVLETLKALDRRTTVSLDRYVHTLDGKSAYWKPLGLSSLYTTESSHYDPKTCMSSLRIAVLDPPGTRSTISSVNSDTCAYQEVDSLLRQHQSLRELYLEVVSNNEEGGMSTDHKADKRHAMERIHLLQPQLTSLTIRGGFSVSDLAWAHWQNLPWSRLEELSLGNHIMITELARRLCYRPLPCLQTLRLFAYDHQWGFSGVPVEEPILREFLRPLGVSQLSLVGFSPETLMHYLRHAPQNQRSIRKLRFHVLEPSLKLTAAHLTELEDCIRLSWLGLDVCRDDLPSHRDPSRALGCLGALAQLRPLAQLRLFIHFSRKSEQLEIQDVVATFQHIRRQKKGCPLESLVICWGHAGSLGTWELWPWGADKAVIDFRQPNRSRRVEVWDASKNRKLEKYAAGWTERRSGDLERLCHPVWGLPENW